MIDKDQLYRAYCLVFPERCPYCSEIIKSGKIACDSCTKNIVDLQRPIIRGTYGYRCVSSFVYKGSVRRMILHIKYRDKIQYIAQVASILAENIIHEYDWASFDLITFVPMHKIDLKKRGYNQSELLAKELSKRLKIPYLQTIDKIRYTKKQQRCSYKERKTNLKGAFTVTDKEAVKGKRILIVDDIITSGETLGACCRTISKGKPTLLCCATIANANVVAADKARI